MKKEYRIGIIGCGDFLNVVEHEFTKSTRGKVVSLYDPAQERAAYWGRKIGGTPAESANAIIEDPDIDMVCLFVPPWLRKDLFVRAVAAGKHILATKPLANNIEAADDIVKVASSAKVRSAIIYNRTGSAIIEQLHAIFESGEIGRLALYRQDWLHHYPQWNKWALDRTKNGGPFIDAMIHNLNAVRYLMARPATKATFFADNLAHSNVLSTDTESLKIDFAGGTAMLFITWAADMAIFANDTNDREHIDVFYMITDQGWRVVLEQFNGRQVIAAHRGFETKRWAPALIKRTSVDRYIDAIESGGDLPGDLVSVTMAAEDIRMLRRGEQQIGSALTLHV